MWNGGCLELKTRRNGELLVRGHKASVNKMSKL